MTRPRMPSAVADDVTALAMGRCERCWTLYRLVRSGTEIHHRITRSRARDLHDRMNCVLLCTSCHHNHAHGGNEWPWMVGGYTLRGRYVGGDPTYHHVYNGQPMPSMADMAQAYPDADDGALVWALTRARDAAR